MPVSRYDIQVSVTTSVLQLKRKKKISFFSLRHTREQCYSKKGMERVTGLQLHKSVEQPEHALEGSSMCSSQSIVILHASCNSVLSHIILEHGCFLNAIFVFRLIEKLEKISCCHLCSRSHWQRKLVVTEEWHSLVKLRGKSSVILVWMLRWN